MKWLGTTIALLILVALAPKPARAQADDPAWTLLDRAYRALNTAHYDTAIALFREAAATAPARTDIRKNLAYTLLKIGEQEAARDQFAEAMRIDPADHHVALEYAFLCNETKKQREARLVFDRVRKTGDPTSRTTAETAFDNIDRPLREGIARWSEAVAREPDNFSAHFELATLAEQRDDWSLAAIHYSEARRLKPENRTLLLDLGRAWRALGRNEDANAALLAASRGAEPRAADTARSLLGDRYPYVYEFRKALEFDPANIELRRELAYLLLEMERKDEAETEFRAIVEAAETDLLSAAQLGFLRLQRKDTAGAMPLLERVLNSEDADQDLQDRVRSALGLPKQLRKRPETPRRQVSDEARDLAEKSLQAGYLKDALKYLTIAHENDPVDFGVMLQLGWTNNLLKQDREAADWFAMARLAPDPTLAAEAQRAYTNLRPEIRRTRTTVWALPFYSSRWKDVFTYGQVKTTIRTGLPIQPYLSLRFIGDTRGSMTRPYPQYLSESSFIFGAGVATPYYKGAMGWVELGSAVSYLNRRDQASRTRPDYRGGVSYSRGFGRLLGAAEPGPFLENHEDAVFVSRFQNSFLFYTQNKAGYTFAPVERMAGLRLQLYWNANLTGDAKRQAWANFAETGPGIRLRWRGLPEAVVFSADLLRGVQTIQEKGRAPNFNDLRIGFWYAFTR